MVGTLIIIIFIVIIVLRSCANSDTTNSHQSNTNDDELRNIEPEYFLNARELVNAYDENEISADNKYEDVWVIIDGKIRKIGKDILGKPYIILRGYYTTDGVQCMFEDESQLVNLKKEDNVRVKGRISGLSIGTIIVRKCSLIETNLANCVEC